MDESLTATVLRRATLVSPSFGTKSMQDVFVDSAGRICEIQPYRSDLEFAPKVIVRDLDGLVVIPGLIDSHFHMIATGVAELTTNLATAESIDNVLERLAAGAAAHGSSEWLVASHLDDYRVREKRLPTLVELDACLPATPVFIEHRSRHFAMVNTPAIRRLGVNDDNVMDAREVENLRQGVLKGDRLRDARQRVMRELGPDFLKRAMQVACEAAARRGTTTVHAIEGGDLFGDEMLPAILAAKDSLAVWVVPYWITTRVADVHKA
jgi:predicted amidohydrolase YtcJ